MHLTLHSHIFAHPQRVSKDRFSVCLWAGTAAVTVILRGASPASAAHLHLRSSLCLHGDDTDKDGAANFHARIVW